MFWPFPRRRESTLTGTRVENHMTTVLSAGLTDIGRSRSKNEDSFLIVPPLYLVADGMGGAAAGEVASRMAVEIIAAELAGFDCGPEPSVEKRAREAIEKADRDIKRLMREDPGLLGMGTTLVMAIPCGARLFMANIGDSRAYRITADPAGMRSKTVSNAAATGIMPLSGEEPAAAAGNIARVTRDHSVVMEMVAAGIITEADIRTHPLLNRITRALGSFGRAEPEFYWFDLAPGDTYLLCTDGLWEMLHEDLIHAIVRSSDNLGELNDRLVKAANNAGGADNITVVTIRVG